LTCSLFFLVGGWVVWCCFFVLGGFSLVVTRTRGCWGCCFRCSVLVGLSVDVLLVRMYPDNTVLGMDSVGLCIGLRSCLLGLLCLVVYLVLGWWWWWWWCGVPFAAVGLVLSGWLIVWCVLVGWLLGRAFWVALFVFVCLVGWLVGWLVGLGCLLVVLGFLVSCIASLVWLGGLSTFVVDVFGWLGCLEMVLLVLFLVDTLVLCCWW